ncbi:MAG: hypothetical protein IM674_09855 [Brevundimonas sp.]|nr:hypothetical protein [Brevundimonas sp.]
MEPDEKKTNGRSPAGEQSHAAAVEGPLVVDELPKAIRLRNLVKQQVLDAGMVQFTPRTVQALRLAIARGVANATPLAVEAMMGRRKWSHQQVQLYRTMLAKVVPDLEAKLVQGEILHRHVGELSKEDLLRLVTEEG